MPTLESLPDELLLRIIDNLTSHHDVAVLSQQCRRFHHLSDLSTRRKYRRVKLRSKNSLKTAFNMLLSILRKPRLGSYVRYLELDRSPWYGHGGDLTYKLRSPQVVLGEEDLGRLKRAIERADFGDGEEEMVLSMLLQDPDTMGWDDRVVFLSQALAALLISVSPKLESLAFCPVTWGGWSKYSQLKAKERGEESRPPSSLFQLFLDRANNAAANNLALPYLQNLRTVRFLSDSDSMLNDGRFYEDYDVYGSLNLVRRLPAVESVRFDAIVESENPSVRLPPRSANYTRIIIRHSMLDYHYHSNLIESAKVLKEFTFSIGGRASSDSSLRIISPDRLLRSLLIHRGTLDHLDLNMEDHVSLDILFNDDDSYQRRRLFEDDDEETTEHERLEYEMEWADELELLSSSSNNNNIKKDDEDENPPRCSLKSFHHLKHLSLGIYLLLYYALGIGDDKINLDDSNWESFSLADHLPPNLESLCIYGYDKGNMEPPYGIPDFHLDAHVAKFMEEKEAKLPSLKVVEGVDELVPNDTSVEDPDDSPELLWEREEVEWTDYEY